MNDISQTKEGFIKSMILFIVLLGICFAPFFAFAQNSNAINTDVKNIRSTGNSTANSAVVSEAGENAVDFEFRSLAERLNLKFKTGFNCVSYSLEARSSVFEEFEGISYCNDVKCADAISGIEYNLNAAEYPYAEFRIKAIKEDGTVVYSDSKVQLLQVPNEVELINSAASDQLFLKWNAINAGYTFSISSINGEEIKYDEPVTGESIQLGGIEAGFYIISLKSNTGNVYRYKFFKTINL
ncbi:MAG TPA: T9SS type A sorting domain-containing protein [Bacteroidia bacterium]